MQFLAEDDHARQPVAYLPGPLDVNACHSRLRQWLRMLHGVATRYLPNDLGWRWIIDARRVLSQEGLLRATVGSFAHLDVT